MLETKETSALLAAVRSARRRQRNPDAALGLEARRQMARRNRVAARFQERALRKVLDAAGVEYAQIQKRQAQDAAGIRKLIDQQRRAAGTYAKEVARRNAAQLAQLAEQLPTTQDWDPATIFLNTAVRIEATSESHSGGASIAWKSHELAPYRNVAKGALLANSDSGLEWTHFSLAFDFLWFADRTGLLFGGWNLNPLVHRILYVKPACTGNLSASAGMSARLVLWSYDAQRRAQTMASPYRDLGHRSLEGADSSGQLALEMVDTELNVPAGLGSAWIAITAGKPVVITVELFAYTYGYRGLAELRFDGPHEINVPLVRLVAG